jgi:4,5-DOPA dioxygenase extradiol
MNDDWSMKKRMPVLFIGHGSPMNALESNSWTRHLAQLALDLPTPKGIVCVSAHWMTPITKRLYVAKPRTIHDFYGFPEALYQVQYAAPGLLLEDDSFSTKDEQWGFDHGTWSVLRHMYPGAHIPVTQLSLNSRLNFESHTKVGEQLRKLREQDILVVGSGNITHNLRDLDFSPRAQSRDWAVEFDERTREGLEKRDYAWLWNQKPQYQKLWQTAHPSTEHYLPLLYALGASDENDKLSFPYTEFQGGSLSMRTVLYN